MLTLVKGVLGAAAALSIIAGAVFAGGVRARAQFRNAVNLVIVPVSVSDPTGHFAGDLTRSDFTIFEDGVERPVSDFSSDRTAVSIGTLIDISGSMQGARFADAQQAMSRLTDRLTPDDRMFLATFNEAFTLVTPWTQDRQALLRALAGVKPKGGTYLYKALSSALPLLDDETARKKALVLISDGDDNEKPGGAMNREGLARVVAQAKASDAVIYAVAIGTPKPDTQEMARLMRDPEERRRMLYDPPIDGEQLRRLTDPTGGYTQFVATSAGLTPTVIRIVDDLSQQYILGFEPAHAADGKAHALKVSLRDPRLVIRARSEYVASPRP